jgi:site-specific recombinase XerD
MTGPRSLPSSEWPDSDRRAWEEACRHGLRLKPGGAASYLATVSRDDYANRYGAFLGFLQRTGRLDTSAAAAAQVTLANIEAYVCDLQERVRSGTVYNAVSKLRRAAKLMAPATDFSWLAEIEEDLKLVVEPRPKFDRLVDTDRLIQVGLTLMTEATLSARTEVARAKGVRDGLMIALLAFRSIRQKNFAALEIGATLRRIGNSWWIVLDRRHTKTHRPDERRFPNILTPYIDQYLNRWRPVLLGSGATTNALWISSTTGRAMTAKNMGTLISKITRECIGVDVSPHLFRTAAASTAAVDGGSTPHLASALLGHTDPRVTEEHYIRASSHSAAKAYADIVDTLMRDDISSR